MGGIDTDPATSEAANLYLVKAKNWFDVEKDGLAQQWIGRVWMNPPYSRGLIEAFVEKLVQEYKAGRTSQACVLVNNASDTYWFNSLLAIASAICLPSSRIHFFVPDGYGGVQKGPSKPLQGQAIFYVGTEKERFRSAFSKYGHCLERMKEGEDAEA